MPASGTNDLLELEVLRMVLIFTDFSINGKYSIASPDKIQPYLLFGISSDVLLIKKGALDTATGETGDGSGINLGVGNLWLP